MAIDFETDVGAVRLLIPDVDTENMFFIDPAIEAFLRMSGGNVRLATAQALDVIASSEAMISKKLTIDGRSTDGPAVAAELRARATELRRQVDAGEGDDTIGFDVLDFDPWRGYRGYNPDLF
ncbi:hypothetical protein DQ384_05420 [Sphaerisporangium album]|uniref:Uncharacterized protein n=1 Tax=Sphaerisporangium album TaxID=509200 RepID=A0A367FQ67_9ACTN|nr:hypothetical protein [Sphaerisporangium album]RCG31982.1 hypothetical protein DQ384_05420 [Sphaerisporangium album]